MYLNSFAVKNYKCLGEIDISLTPIHVLIGENDCGKSSLLEAIEIFTNSANQELSRLFPQTDNKSELFNYNLEDNSLKFKGEISYSSQEQTDGRLSYEFTISYKNDGDIHVQSEKIGIAEIRTSHFRPDNVTMLRAINTNSFNLNQYQSEGLKDRINILCDALKPSLCFSFIAKELSQPAPLNLENNFKLEKNGFGLAKLLDDLLEYDASQYLKLEHDFCELFPQFKKIRQNKINVTGNGIGKRILFETISGNTIHANMASEGALLILGYLALTYVPSPPPLLLIEEPENGIYPKRLAEVINLLKKLAAGADHNGIKFPQIILTTHSPYVLSFFEPEEVTFLSRPQNNPDGPVRARQLKDAPNIKERMGGEFYLGELWYNLSEEELFGNA